MSQFQALTLGAEKGDCFLINEDALVHDGGTGPVLTNTASGQQVCKFDDQEELITTSGQSSCVVSVNAEHNFLAFALSGSPNRLQLAFLNSAPKFVAIQQQQLAASCAYSSVALSTDGNHLLAFCGPAQPYLELWSLSPLQSLLAVDTGPQDHGVVPLKSRPGSSWACDSPLTAEPLLKKDGSILDKPKAVIGTSSGHVLLVSISNQSEGQPIQSEPGNTATPSDMFSAHNLSEAVPNSTAALAITALPEQHAATITSAQLSPDGRSLATISAGDGAVFVWDTLPGSMADLYVAAKATIAGASCAAWLPGKRLLVGSSSHQLVMLAPSASGVMGDPWSQQPLCRLQSAPLALLSGLDPALASTSSPLPLYAALQDKSVHKYQLNMSALTLPSKTKAMPLLSPQRGFPMQKTCSGLLLSAAGKLLAAASDGCCYVLDAESLQQEARHPLHPSQRGKLLTL
ncbi:hypothetical protein ABBQ38_003623 [Trebouxia sp. C0009 RCD-2024]